MNRLAQWIAGRQLPVRTAFIVMMIVGAPWAAAGLFAPTATNFVVGVIVAMLGWTGFGACEWVDR